MITIFVLGLWPLNYWSPCQWLLAQRIMCSDLSIVSQKQRPTMASLSWCSSQTGPPLWRTSKITLTTAPWKKYLVKHMTISPKSIQPSLPIPTSTIFPMCYAGFPIAVPPPDIYCLWQYHLPCPNHISQHLLAHHWSHLTLHPSVHPIHWLCQPPPSTLLDI